MSAISDFLIKIKNAVYGIEVRDAIHDSIKQCYDDVNSAKTIADESLNKVNTAADNANEKAELANKAAENANSKASAADMAANNADNKATEADKNNKKVVELLSNASVLMDQAANARDLANNSAKEASVKAELADVAANNANNKAMLADTAANNANSKAEIANSKASIADTAANNANSKAELANNAAKNANEKAELANNASVIATEKISAMTVAMKDISSATDNANRAAHEAQTNAINAKIAEQTAKDATTLANEATSNANDATSECNAIISQAKIINNNAEEATEKANKAYESIENLSITSEDVGPNSEASATLLTGQNGFKKIHIKLRQGKDGIPYVIKGKAYSTLEELKNSGIDFSVGDMYNVGSKPPYTVYRWTGSEWESQGEIGSSLESISKDDIDDICLDKNIDVSKKRYLDISGLVNLNKEYKELFNGKVDKMENKGLSTNDFTDEYKNDIKIVKDNVVSLQNDKVDKISGKSLSTNDFTTAYKNRIDENRGCVAELRNSKVDKEQGKGLSSNDFTDEYINRIKNLGSEQIKIKGDILTNGNLIKQNSEKINSVEEYLKTKSNKTYKLTINKSGWEELILPNDVTAYSTTVPVNGVTPKTIGILHMGVSFDAPNLDEIIKMTEEFNYICGSACDVNSLQINASQKIDVDMELYFTEIGSDESEYVHNIIVPCPKLELGNLNVVYTNLKNERKLLLNGQQGSKVTLYEDRAEARPSGTSRKFIATAERYDLSKYKSIVAYGRCFESYPDHAYTAFFGVFNDEIFIDDAYKNYGDNTYKAFIASNRLSNMGNTGNDDHITLDVSNVNGYHRIGIYGIAVFDVYRFEFIPKES